MNQNLSTFFKILKSSASQYQKFGNVYRKLVVPRILKKSKKVITVSHFEKNRIGEFFGIKGDHKLDAIYNGVSKHFKPVTDKEELRRVKEKYNLPFDFLFCDETTLKTIIRANPGVVILNKGTVMQKKNWVDVEDLEL